MTTEFHSGPLTNWAIRTLVQLALRANFVQLLQFYLVLQSSRLISVFSFISQHIPFKQSLAQLITLVAKWIDTYGIHHWRILRSSYTKLPRVEFEWTKTTKLRSHALTNWAIRSRVQLALRGNFVQLLQFHLFIQCSWFISVFAFISRHICFKQSLAQVITLVGEWISTYGILYWTILRAS